MNESSAVYSWHSIPFARTHTHTTHYGGCIVINLFRHNILSVITIMMFHSITKHTSLDSFSFFIISEPGRFDVMITFFTFRPVRLHLRMRTHIFVLLNTRVQIASVTKCCKLPIRNNKVTNLRQKKTHAINLLQYTPKWGDDDNNNKHNEQASALIFKPLMAEFGSAALLSFVVFVLIHNSLCAISFHLFRSLFLF